MIQSVIDHLWQSTVFAALIGAVTLAFRADRANVRFWLWFAASVKFLVPFSLLVALGDLLQLPAAPVPLAEIPWSETAVQFAQPATALATEWAPQVAAQAAASEAWDIASILFAVWIGGVAALSLRWLAHWLRLRALVNGASPLALDLPVATAMTSALSEPALVGIFSPVLLLPEGIAAHLTPPQLDAVLAHEIHHWRRRDNLFAAVHMAVETLVWFHPLVWWLTGRLITERERACDEAVIVQGADRQSYAEGLLAVCQQHVLNTSLVSAGVSGGNLRQRIARIMTKPVRGNLGLTKKAILTAAAVLTLTAPVALGAVLGPEPTAQAAIELFMPKALAPLRVATATVDKIETVFARTVALASTLQPPPPAPQATPQPAPAVFFLPAPPAAPIVVSAATDVTEEIVVRGTRPPAIRNARPLVPSTNDMDGREGWVHLQVAVSSTGAVTAVKILEAYPKGDFERAVMRVASSWRFDPRIEDGVAVPEPAFEVGVAFYNPDNDVGQFRQSLKRHRRADGAMGARNGIGNRRGVSAFNYSAFRQTIEGLFDAGDVEAAGKKLGVLQERYQEGDMTVSDVARYLALRTRYERLKGDYNASLREARRALLLTRFLDNGLLTYGLHLEIMACLTKQDRGDEAIDFYDSWRAAPTLPPPDELAAYVEGLRAQGYRGKGRRYTIMDYDESHRGQRNPPGAAAVESGVINQIGSHILADLTPIALNLPGPVAAR